MPIAFSVMTPPSPRRHATLALAGSTLILLLVLAMLAAAYRLPAPRAVDAPALQFSAGRAIEALAFVLGDQAPHPVGSPANAAVRARLVERLRALGHVPEIQHGYHCDYWDLCAAVDNIIVRIPGREPGPAIALSAHYDSVGAAPGAADDGIGLAVILEIARLLPARGEPPRHPLLLLITDGEELALNGAASFIAESPLAAEVRATVNLDAIGNAGPAILFETGRASAELIARLAAVAPSPVANSAWPVAFRRMPNDTDFSVFRRAGWQGYNYALFGRVHHYHTPLDNLANLDAGAVQHMGDNALAALDSLAAQPAPAAGPRYDRGAEPALPRAEQSAYAELARRMLLHGSVSGLQWVSGASLLALLLFAGRLLRGGSIALRPLLSGIVLIGSSLLATGAASLALVGLLRTAGAMPPASAGYGWTAQPLPMLIAHAALAVMVLAALARLLPRRGNGWTLWLALALLQALALLSAVILLPGLAAALLPMLLSTLLGALLPWLFGPGSRQADAPSWLAGLLPVLVAALLLLPMLGYAYPSLGVRVLPVLAAGLLWALLPMLLLLQAVSAGLRRMTFGLALLASLAATALAARQPAYTVERPQRLNYEYREDVDSGRAAWIAEPDSGQLPAALIAAGGFQRLAPDPALPWESSAHWQAAVPALKLAAPQFEVLSRQAEADGRLRVEGRLRSMRGARMLQLCLPITAEVHALTINGVPRPAPDQQRLQAIEQDGAGWRCLEEHGSRPDGVRVAMSLPPTGVNLLLIDRSDGLPPQGSGLLAARPADAVPSQDGDVSRVLRRLTLKP